MKRRLRMCARNNMITSGGGGASYSFGNAVAPGYAEVIAAPSCRSSGGSRRRRGRKASRKALRRRATRKAQRGGTYAASFDPSIVVGTRGAYMPIERVDCAAQRGGSNSLAAETTTAGYTFSPSPFVGATGSPIGLSLPVSGRSCGGRRRTASTRKERKHRK